MTDNTPTSKVLAATVGGGAGATVAAFLLWLLGVLAWGAPATADAATAAVAAVPAPVAGVVLLGVSAAGAFIAGYWKTETIAGVLGRGDGEHRADAGHSAIDPAVEVTAIVAVAVLLLAWLL